MLKKFDEADFIALRGPFESGRQSPKNLSFNLIIAIPLNILLVTLTYLIFGQDEILPYQFAIFIGHVTISVLLIICSLLFVIPAVYIKYQKTQYFLTIATVQVVFSFNFILITLFMIGSPREFSADASTLHTIIFIFLHK